MYLSDLITQQRAIVSKVQGTSLLSNRLEILGFAPQVKIQIITKGIFGGDPILVQIGSSRFALRKSEAQCIHVEGVDE